MLVHLERKTLIPDSLKISEWKCVVTMPGTELSKNYAAIV
jgi:hypothetical protein